MENIPENNLPHEENNPERPYDENDPKSFAKWFREAAKDKWQKYLKGDEKEISIDERDSMRGFLVEHGTKEEINAKLDTFLLDPRPYDALRKEIESKRPEITFN